MQVNTYLDFSFIINSTVAPCGIALSECYAVCAPQEAIQLKYTLQSADVRAAAPEDVIANFQAVKITRERIVANYLIFFNMLSNYSSLAE